MKKAKLKNTMIISNIFSEKHSTNVKMPDKDLVRSKKIKELKLASKAISGKNIL